MARVASHKTLKKVKKIRIHYANRAIERASFSEDKEIQESGDAAMDEMFAGKMSIDDQYNWALKEQEWRLMHD